MATKKHICEYFRIHADGALRCIDCDRLSQSTRYKQPFDAPEYPIYPEVEEDKAKQFEKPEDKSVSKSENK